MDSPKKTSNSITMDNLALAVDIQTIAKYLEIIQLATFQNNSKVIFVLKIPLVNAETFSLFQTYPLLIEVETTGLYHVIKFIARNDDSILYVTLTNFD